MRKFFVILIFSIASTGCYHVSYEGNHIWQASPNSIRSENFRITLFMHAVRDKDAPAYLYLQASADTRFFQTLELSKLEVIQGENTLLVERNVALDQFEPVMGVGFPEHWAGISTRLEPAFIPSVSSGEPVKITVAATLTGANAKTTEAKQTFSFFHRLGSGGGTVNVFTQ